MEEVYRKVWQSERLKEALVALYRYQQDIVGGVNPNDVTELISLGLAVRKGSRFSLTPLGLSLAYNLLEYTNQVEEGGAKPFLAPLQIDHRSVVLDAGCGGGQTLFAALHYHPARVVGFDRDPHGIEFARFVFRNEGVPDDRYEFVLAGMDEVFLPTGGFNRILCRVVLQKLPVLKSLSKLRKAAAPGSRGYFMVMTLPYYLSRLKMLRHQPVWLPYFLFVIVNGLLFAATGRQATVRFGSRRLSELFFTPGSFKRALRRSGFQVERIRFQPPSGWPFFIEAFVTTKIAH